ncbi:hypothetical protein DdX_13934 [Ditylenchus destructor]|uniref:Uncharacterized protein n=1 Tax=Ditylenchus destructor TaxID=166010 RepID=A0AAD4MUF5_9BILA|nr:hypothetical protein DdX_13934 [Ditylenchus destructor]
MMKLVDQMFTMNIIENPKEGKFDEYKIAYLEGYRKALDAMLFFFAYEYNRLKYISYKEVEEQIDKGKLKYRGDTYLPKAHALDPSIREEIRKSELDHLFGEFERITHIVLYLECIIHYGNRPDEKVDRDAECRQKTCKPMRVTEKQQSLWEGWFCPTII